MNRLKPGRILYKTSLSSDSLYFHDDLYKSSLSDSGQSVDIDSQALHGIGCLLGKQRFSLFSVLWKIYMPNRDDAEIQVA